MKQPLAWYELSIAAHVGGLRRALSLKDGREERFDPSVGLPGVLRDICGAAAEQAVAKWRNVYWPGHVDVFHVPDVGRHIAVKYTHHENGHLCVRPDEPDTNMCVLVNGTPPLMNIVGWVMADEAKTAPRNGSDHWVPQSDLVLV